MKATSLLVASVAVGILAITSPASAAYNTPGYAYKTSVDLVAAYNQCTAPTLTYRSDTSISACPSERSSANHPANVYTFGDPATGLPLGTASITLTARKGDAQITAKTKRIWKNGAPYSGADLFATAMARITANGCGDSPFDVDCTTVDFPLYMPLTCTNGSCKSISPTLNGVIPDTVHRNDGSNIDIGQISILDEDGDTFARGGLSLNANAAKSSRVEMVPAYNQCGGPTLVYHSGAPISACAPAQSSANNSASVYEFGDRGFARVTFHPSKSDVKMEVLTRAVLRNGMPYTGDDLLMTWTVRTTDDGCGPSQDVDCTLVDSPSFATLHCVAGKCEATASSWDSPLPDALPAHDRADVEVGQVSVLDEDGDTFARAGIYVP